MHPDYVEAMRYEEMAKVDWFDGMDEGDSMQDFVDEHDAGDSDVEIVDLIDLIVVDDDDVPF